MSIVKGGGLLRLKLLTSLMQDIKRDYSCFAHLRTLLLGVCEKEGFNHKVDVWVRDIAHCESLDDAFFGLVVVNHTGFTLILFYKGN